MKNPIIFLILILTIFINSCKDKDNGANDFQPSLDLDEYVLMNVNGTERIFTTENNIRVRRLEDDGKEKINIYLTPVPQSFTVFSLTIDEPNIGSFAKEQMAFYYEDYSFTNEFPSLSLRCSESQCDGEINLTIYKLGAVNEKVIGEMSGELNWSNGETNQFTGEFVVYRDE